MLYKNVPQAQLNKVLNARWLFDYAAAFQLFITGKPKNASAVFKARGDFAKMKADFEEKRKENILFSTCTACENVLKRSVVLDYYLRNKKTFDRL